VIRATNVQEFLRDPPTQVDGRVTQNLFGQVDFIFALLAIQTVKLLEISIRFAISVAYDGTFAIHCRDCNMVRQWGFNEMF
jgi:hypothetical protein